MAFDFDKYCSSRLIKIKSEDIGNSQLDSRDINPLTAVLI